MIRRIFCALIGSARFDFPASFLRFEKLQKMSEKQADDWFGQKENIQPRRKGQSSGKLQYQPVNFTVILDYLAGLAKQNDPEFQARVKKEQDEWENKVRYEAPENPMIWYDYYTWANKNVFNSYQLKVRMKFRLKLKAKRS
jgi:hypothetical protein